MLACVVETKFKIFHLTGVCFVAKMYIAITSISILVCSLLPSTEQLEFSEALNFVNQSGSVAVYEPWRAARTGTLKFNFKTISPDGLLFYVGDNNDPSKAGNYMYLKLEWGQIVLVTQVHYFTDLHEENKIEERTKIGHDLNDGKWHGVVVERKQALTIVKVDTYSSTLQLADRISNLQVKSDLYIGGIPSIYTEHGCIAFAKEMPRFIGCIKGLVYGEGNYVRARRLVFSEDVDRREMCLDACSGAIRRCFNGGACKNYFFEYKCDCSGTGFEGRHCEKRSTVVTLSGLSYVQSVNRSNATISDIGLNIRTTARQGFVFGAGDSTSYIVLELVNGVIKVSVKLKAGRKHSLSLQDARVNNNQWHYISIVRREQEIRLKLDRRVERSLVLESEDDNNEIKDSVYVGGAWNTDKIFPGFTQIKFCGCLRQVYYNGVDVLKYGYHKGGTRRSRYCLDAACTK
eukprot:gene4631-5238_t